MGGDIVDLVGDCHYCLAYVADVSGHGVSASVLMAMVKCAARMKLKGPYDSAEFLTELNRVMLPLTADDTFVTAACIRPIDEAGKAEFSLAGHLPILHFQAASNYVVEHAVSNLPLGIAAGTVYDSAFIDCAPGDLLAVLPDGFTEASDGKQELGVEGIKLALRETGSKPLPGIYAQVRRRVLAQGRQADDQTLLLIRFLADAPAPAPSGA